MEWNMLHLLFVFVRFKFSPGETSPARLASKMGARAFFQVMSGTGQCAPERGATGLFLNQIANGWPILLDIQHRIAVVSGIQRDVVNGLRTIAHHFQNFPFLS
jgi:hypothetical protein